MKNVGIFLLLCCFWSCKTQHTIPSLHFEWMPLKDYDISSFADKKSYIPLENQSGDTLDYMKTWVDAGRFYYLTDSYRILKYNRKGKYLGEIGKWGIEGGGWGCVMCMDVDASHKHLYVRTLDEMFVFNAKGDLIERIPIDSPSPEKARDGKHSFVFNHQEISMNRRPFFLSPFFITRKNVFLFKNPATKYSNVSVLFCNKKLDSLGCITNNRYSADKSDYFIIPEFTSDGKNYYYREEQNDTLYRINPRLQLQRCIVLRGGVSKVYALHNVLYFRRLDMNVLYSLKSDRFLAQAARTIKNGFIIQQVEWMPLSTSGHYLILQALASDIINNKAYITDPALKRIADRLKTNSGLVLLKLKIKDLKTP